MNILGIIPARGGSKRIKNKNIRLFAGKPLKAWSIESALKSNSIDRVLVSTDSEEIAKIANEYGAEVPFLRPKELAEDTVATEPVVKHAYEWLIKNENYTADAIVLLMPTNPLRTYSHIDEGIRIFKEKNVDSVVSVNETPANHTPYWTITKDENNNPVMWDGSNIKDIIPRSQDFKKETYGRNDLVYVLKPKNLLEEKSNLYGEKVELYITDLLHDADINTEHEWKLTELQFKLLRELS